MTELEFYDMRDELYLRYLFDGESPSDACHVSKRMQAMPSRHRVSIVKDGVEILTKQRGFVMKGGGRKDLPVQKTKNVEYPLMGMSTKAELTQATLPRRVWKQYGRVRVQFERVKVFYEARDNIWDGSVNIYRPIKVVI